MQICASELKTVMKNVLEKREHNGETGIFKFLCAFLTSPSSPPSFFITDSEIKTEGFSLETCRSMIALMDVSFLLI